MSGSEELSRAARASRGLYASLRRFTWSKASILQITVRMGIRRNPSSGSQLFESQTKSTAEKSGIADVRPAKNRLEIVEK